jgi:hypothetical protein
VLNAVWDHYEPQCTVYAAQVYAYPQGVGELADGLVGAGQRAVVALLEQTVDGYG